MQRPPGQDAKAADCRVLQDLVGRMLARIANIPRAMSECELRSAHARLDFDPATLLELRVRDTIWLRLAAQLPAVLWLL